MSLPSLSVITPTLNSEEYVADALLSVSRQQGVTAEHIVVDGASTDNTLAIVKRYRSAQWTSERDRGQSDAINKGFLRASGELVGWLNADDYYLPGGLEAIARTAQEHPEADIIHGDCVFVDGAGKIVRSKVEHGFDRSVLLYFGCYIPSTATFFRRRVIDSGMLLNCDYRVCMDFEYFVRLASAGFKFCYVPRFIAAFRWHASNVSLQHLPRRTEERQMVQRRFGQPDLSLSTLDLLSSLHRAKRILRKTLSGNVLREFQVRRMMGRDTRWLSNLEGQQTCQALASL